MLKKQKICKGCLKAFVESPKVNRIGITKYCSVKCYIQHKNKKKAPIQYKPTGKKYEVSGTKQFKQTLKDKTILKDGTSVQKELPERDSKYLKHVRSLPCIVCGNKENNHAHHAEFSGLGQKGSDHSAVSLCVAHHTGGNDCIHKLGIVKFEIKHNLKINEIQAKQLKDYIKRIK